MHSFPRWGILLGFTFLGSLPGVLHAAFPVTAANINHGTVLPQSPAWPFPQFLDYAYGRTVAGDGANPAFVMPGVTHAEMEQTIIQMYVEGMRRLRTVAGWRPAGLPNRLAFTTTGCGGATGCSEGDGYALLMAALMADKDTFDGLWVEVHSHIPGVVSYETGAVQQPGYSATCKDPGMINWTHTDGDDAATDGDMDVALALLIAWRQWGPNSGYLQANGQPISYRDEFLQLTGAMAAWRPNPGDPGGYYDDALIGIDGYLKPANTNGALTNWANVPHPPNYPQRSGFCTSQGVGTCPGEMCLSYLAPGYFRCFASVHEALGNTHQANQYRRAAVSSEYIIEQLNAQRPPFSIGADGFTVEDNGTVTFQGTWGGPLKAFGRPSAPASTTFGTARRGIVGIPWLTRPWRGSTPRRAISPTLTRPLWTTLGWEGTPFGTRAMA